MAIPPFLFPIVHMSASFLKRNKKMEAIAVLSMTNIQRTCRVIIKRNIGLGGRCVLAWLKPLFAMALAGPRTSVVEPSAKWKCKARVQKW